MGRRLRPPTLRTTEQPREPARPSVPTDSTGILPGAVTSSQMALTQEASWQANDFTTTTVGTSQLLASASIFIPNDNCALYVSSGADFSHSAAAATCSFHIGVTWDGDGGSEYALMVANNLSAPITGTRNHVALATLYNVNTNLVLVKRGRDQLIKLYVKNLTAGTLTIHADAVYGVFGFVAGDST